MATEYSLLTWAGLGTTVTFTDAGDIVSFTAHGAPNGHAFRFTTTGTLPTGLTAGTTYYIRQGADVNKFVIHPTQPDAIVGTNQVTFTGTGSGTHKVVGEYWSALDTAGRSRYGAAGSELVYANLAAWEGYINTASNRNLTKDIVLEIQGKWVDSTSFANAVQGYKSITIHTKINGVRNPDAFHCGIVGNGWANVISNSSASNILTNQPYTVIDGLEVRNTNAGASARFAIGHSLPGSTTRNCILQSGYGLNTFGTLYYAYNNIFIDCLSGGIKESSTTLGVVTCNLATGCAVGFASGAPVDGIPSSFIGNIAINNTVNYAGIGVVSGSRFNAQYNLGASTDVKTVTFENSATPGTLTCRLTAHGFAANRPIIFRNGGGATAPTGVVFGVLYYIKVIATDTFTLSTTIGGTAIAYTNSGSGTITTSLVWDTTNTSGVVATTDFMNFASRDFRPALASSPQVELITLFDGDGFPRYDIADAARPNYINVTTDKADAGPFEFDHGNGLVPNYQNFTISGLISGSRVKVKKTSDGTVIHNAIVNATSLTISYNAGTADTPVTIDIAKGNAAPYYYRYRTTATISYLTASGVSVSQIPDIACATYPAGVATDWAANTTTKVISNASGSTVYTVQNLYSWLCDYYDHSSRVDLDMPMYGTTSEIFGLQNSGSISDAHMQKLKGGSIKDGTTLWTNVYTVGTQATSTPIYVHVNDSLYTSYWSTGNIDVLLKLTSWAGTEVVDVRAHNYSDTYDHWRMTISGQGRNVAAISTADDPDNQTASATVAGWSDITVMVDNPIGKAIDASDTPADYTTTINGAGRPVTEVYERLKYLTKSPSTYISANAAYSEVKESPYGTLSAGIFSGAQGIWLENVASGDALNYVLTDNAGVAHQAAAPPVQILVTNLVDGEAIQLYDLTNNVQLAVGYVTGTTYSYEMTWTEDLDIRVRHISFGGVTATKFQEEQGEFTATGMNMRATQEPDTVYNANGIDGSAVTGVTINDGTLRVEVATGSISWGELYAYETYWLSTVDGIVDEGRFAVAVDTANYLWYDFKLKNTTDPSVPLTITGGYGRDGATDTVLGLFDTTGGSIFPAPDHVVPYSSGAEATVAIVQAGLTAQGYSTSRAPKLDNLDAPVSGGSGGLTEAEHNQLMNTLTVPKFIGLK